MLLHICASYDLCYLSKQDQVATPAEIAKAYMGLKSSKGSPLRLRLHDPSSMPITSMEVSMSQKAKPPTIPLAQGSRLHTSKTSDCLESNYTTPNGVICKMSSSPYFKVYSLLILSIYFTLLKLFCVSAIQHEHLQTTNSQWHMFLSVSSIMSYQNLIVHSVAIIATTIQRIILLRFNNFLVMTVSTLDK